MQRSKRVSSARVLVALSSLAAIGIILGKFLAFNITEFMRFSLENTSIIFAGIVFGPLSGAVVGAVQDLVGCLAVGYTINPIITLGCALIGCISGLSFRLLRKMPLGVRVGISVTLSHLLGSVTVKTVGLVVFYSLPFTVTFFWRLLNYVIVGSLEIVLLTILLKSKQLLSQINKITSFSIGGFSSYKEAESFVKTVSGVFSKPGLERVTELLERCGSPERYVPKVHVSGTNGKGSTVSMLTSILSYAGLRVGAFTSPYLIEMRECIRILGEPIGEDTLASLFDRLKPHAEQMADKPTEFELLTAAAFLAFKEADLDVAVIECGMGGKGDATNVIDSPLISIITNVSLDHTSFLGSTLKEIAEQKSGIIKKGSPVLFGGEDGEAYDVILSEAQRLEAPLYRRSHSAEIISMSLSATVFNYGDLKDLSLSLLGAHQVENASLAIEAANILREVFPAINERAIRAGLKEAKWRGRFEQLSSDPIFIFDGAHNLDGIKKSTSSIKEYFSDRVVIISGVLRDKQYEMMADEISMVADRVYTITPHNSRALSAEEYAQVLSSKGIVAIPEPSVTEGVISAVKYAKALSRSVVCLGSLYLYPDVFKAVESLAAEDQRDA